MFERYTEKARRVIFFARYEASQYGSPEIDSEHLLLGLLRESKSLWQWIPKARPDELHQLIDARIPKQPRISTAIDLPLSDAGKVILKAAADEADRLNHHSIGTEHIFLGLFAVEDCLAKLLRQAGTDPNTIRLKLSQQVELDEAAIPRIARTAPHQTFSNAFIMIHGIRRKTDHIRDIITMLRLYNWHWHKAKWTPPDILVNRKTGQVSFETALGEDAKTFALVKNGWKKDHCFICRWELVESDDEHGIGYTNGRVWLCMECCERFIFKDYFASSYAEIT